MPTPIQSQVAAREAGRHDALCAGVRRGDSFFKTNKAQTIAILKKYAKSDLATLDSAHTYLKGSIPDLPYPTLEGMKTILAEMGRTRPEVLKYEAATMVDASIVKAIDEEGFLKKLKAN